MKTSAQLNSHVAGLTKFIAGCHGSNHGLDLTLVYEDAETRQWAKELHEQLARLAGTATIRATWWKLSELSQPGVLAGAASTAMRADIVVVATRATEGMPLPFYVWVKQWLPNRRSAAGALVALLGAPEKDGTKSGRVADYLESIAGLGKLQFLLSERIPAKSYPPFATEMLAM
jgi:hypothetical protein